MLPKCGSFFEFLGRQVLQGILGAVDQVRGIAFDSS
jgi:hypothetical protein